MSRPVAPIVRIRLAYQLRRRHSGWTPEQVAATTAEILEIVAAADLDLVRPGWVPVTDETRRFRWGDIAEAAEEFEERAPWLPPQ